MHPELKTFKVYTMQIGVSLVLTVYTDLVRGPGSYPGPGGSGEPAH